TAARFLTPQEPAACNLGSGLLLYVRSAIGAGSSASERSARNRVVGGRALGSGAVPAWREPARRPEDVDDTLLQRAIIVDVLCQGVIDNSCTHQIAGILVVRIQETLIHHALPSTARTKDGSRLRFAQLPDVDAATRAPHSVSTAGA